MREQSRTAVSVGRSPGAPAARLFEILTRAANHPLIDGSGVLPPATSDDVPSGVGDVFTMAMRNSEMGSDEIESHVVVFEPDRCIVWELVLSTATRPEDVDAIESRAPLVGVRAGAGRTAHDGGHRDLRLLAVSGVVPDGRAGR